MNPRTKMILAVLGVLMIAGVALQPQDKPKDPALAQEALEVDYSELSKKLSAGAAQRAPAAAKTRGEIEAEGKYREGLREYNNQNFVRAIIMFQESLTQNPELIEASDYLQFAEARLKIQVQALMRDAQRNFATLQYGRAKSQFMNVLMILSEQIPGYWQRAAQKSMNRGETERRPANEEDLLQVPCDKTRDEKSCRLAVDYIRQSRKALGEEDVIQ